MEPRRSDPTAPREIHMSTIRANTHLKAPSTGPTASIVWVDTLSHTGDYGQHRKAEAAD
jgi:hypothetical protein